MFSYHLMKYKIFDYVNFNEIKIVKNFMRSNKYYNDNFLLNIFKIFLLIYFLKIINFFNGICIIITVIKKQYSYFPINFLYFLYYVYILYLIFYITMIRYRKIKYIFYKITY